MTPREGRPAAGPPGMDRAAGQKVSPGFLVFSEMIPEGVAYSGRANTAAAVVVGFLVMMILQNVLQ